MKTVDIPEPEELRVKRRAWHKQHAALGAPTYRITLMPRRDGLKPRNFRNELRKKRGLEEVFWTAADVDRAILNLGRCNARGYDVYITPIDHEHHYLIIDDVTEAMLAEVQRAGYRPCLVQTSSRDNNQIVLRSVKVEVSKGEQSAANTLVVALNREFGDPKFSGAIHPFRMAGFSNKKPGKLDAFTRIVEANAGRLCPVTADLLASERALRSAQNVNRADNGTEHSVGRVGSEAVPRPSPATAVMAAFEHERKKVLGWVKRRRLPVDESRVDLRAATDLLRSGWPVEAVRGALATSSDVATRHRDPLDYARRTVQVALSRATRLK